MRQQGTDRWWTVGLAVLALSLLLGGCAATKKRRPPPKPTGFPSADAKNVHDFMARYPAVIMSRDVSDIVHLYTEDARIVPFIGRHIRPLFGKGLPRQIEAVVAEERQADLRIRFHEPFSIKVNSETAVVKLVAELTWQEDGRGRHAVMQCYFGLARQPGLLWKIKEAHAEPVTTGFKQPVQATPKQKAREMTKFKHGRVQPKKVRQASDNAANQPQQLKPLVVPQRRAAPPADQDTGTTPGPIVPDVGQNPQPLF